MKAIRIIGLLVAIAFAFAGGYIYKAVKGSTAGTADKGGRKVLYWVDPMHPAYKSDKPGIAPDCGMKLVPVYAAEQKKEASNAPAERKVLYWVDAMNPSHKSDKPGIAPDGMKLVPVYADEEKKTA